MPDLLINNIDAELYARIAHAAEIQRKSVEQFVRDTLIEKFKPSKEEIWADADLIRKKIGKVPGDLTQIIREWRDNDEPYR